MRKTQDRALDYRRTTYKPGVHYCPCEPCRAAARQSMKDQIAGLPGLPSGAHIPECAHVNPELAFAELWEEECKPRPGINFGMGLVQDLMVLHGGKERAGQKGWSWDFLGGGGGRYLRVAFRLTPRERVICATVVQWLGTNCGFGFLHQALRRCGYRIVELEAPPALPQEIWDARNRAETAEAEAKRLAAKVAAQDAELAVARPILARLNLGQPVPACSTPVARFLGIEDDGLPVEAGL